MTDSGLRSQRHGDLFPHFHWFGEVVWTAPDGVNPPYKRCRCGATKQLGNSARWGVGLDGGWFYDEATYE